MKHSPITQLTILLVALMMTVSTAQGRDSHTLERTALDRYVNSADPSYQYDIIATVNEPRYTSYIVSMTSQRWLTEQEVNLPLWHHYMSITVPTTIRSNIGFLEITGGSKLDRPPTQAPASDIRRALQSGTVVSSLFGVPNQPLIFSDSPKTLRVEDNIIAYSWDKYLRSGDDKWPLRLPMTKAAVRAMDTVTDLVARQRTFTVDQFVLAGGSKRGWTAWTTAAVDRRVVAIIPVVIDMLNISESFKHHYSVYGGYAPAVGDYVKQGNINWMGTAQWDSLMAIVEPFEYRDRLSLPKYLLNSTGDEFFIPDSWKFYWHQLPGEKHLRYVPNSNHSMAGTDVLDSIDAWYYAQVHNIPMPRYSWNVEDDGGITVMSLDKPNEVLLWQAHNPKQRNFMQAVIGKAYTSTVLTEQEPGIYRAKVATPKTGFTAFYIEMSYPSGSNLPLKFSSGTSVVPDRVAYSWKMTADSSRKLQQK